MPFENAEVAAVFERFDTAQKTALLALRQIVFDVATKTRGVGRLEEVLRWKQPSYITAETGSGSTIRIDAQKGSAQHYAMYFHCQSGLVEHFRLLYPKVFRFEGKRAMIFEVGSPLPEAELQHCVSLALTYHRWKRSKP
jgi:Domain of unknown function (DU1801)